MENYIVRVYRREEDNPRTLVGVVEEVGVEGNKAFTSIDELFDILGPRKRKGSRKLRKQVDKRMMKGGLISDRF